MIVCTIGHPKLAAVWHEELLFCAYMESQDPLMILYMRPIWITLALMSGRDICQGIGRTCW